MGSLALEHSGLEGIEDDDNVEEEEDDNVEEEEDDDDEEVEEEEEEDISHLFRLDEDGNLAYDNPETGAMETLLVSSDDSDDSEEENDRTTREEEDDDETVALSNRRNENTTTRKGSKPKKRRLFLRVGEDVQVYVKLVSKQSSQVVVTTDPTMVKGKKGKEIKRNKDVTKKLDRLAKQLGGLQRVQELEGKEYDGTVKAISQSGDWMYVKPNDEDLPVGVAAAHEGGSAAFVQGDPVRIKMKGIDEGRGQLAMEVIEKLAP